MASPQSSSESEEHAPLPPVNLDLLAALFSYLIPGMGQVYQGRVGKGLLFFFGLYLLFFYGCGWSVRTSGCRMFPTCRSSRSAAINSRACRVRSSIDRSSWDSSGSAQRPGHRSSST